MSDSGLPGPATARPPRAYERLGALQRARSLWQSAGMLGLYLVIFAACSLLFPNFLTRVNMVGLAQLITTVGIVSCGMLFCLASGDFDLSVGSTAAFSGVVTVMLINATGSVTMGIAGGIAAGALVGLFNGLVVAGLGINALIATLATMQIVRGLTFAAAHNTSVGSMNATFRRLFGTAELLGIPAQVWVMGGCFLVCGLLLHKTVFGRNVLAIGGNREAARLAGVATTRTKVLIFVLQGSLAALAGVVEASQAGLGDPNASIGLELRVISACVLGGVSLTGGVGTILAVIVGTLIMGTVQDAMNLNSINTNSQYIVSGGILLGAALFDRAKQRWA
jgi:L-arabinose transport system permease protein